MFEDSTNYDIDDDDLGTSFTPVFSSTQGFSQKQRQTEEIVPTNSKKLKLDVNSDQSNQRLVLERKSSFQSVLKQDSAFCSPNKVVKRTFPGPAGLLPDRLEGNKSISELISEEHVEQTNEFMLCSQRTVSVFEDGPWKNMTEDFATPDSEQLYEKFNINWIKQSSALKKQAVSYNAPFLAAIIQSVTIEGESKIPSVSVTLKDSTGVIGGTIIHSLYEENVDAFAVGSVLVLKQFGVLSMEDSYCVPITSNNLVSIYYSNMDKNKTVQRRQSCVEKIVLQECSVEDIWKQYKDYLAEISKQKSASKPNLRKLLTSHNDPSNNYHKGNENNFSSNILPRQTDTVRSVAQFNFKKTSEEPNGQRNVPRQSIKADNSSKNASDGVTISCSQISVKTDERHTEIWKNLLEDVDTDALFDDF